MIEVAAALSVAGSAFNMIKNAVERGQEIHEVADVFSKFFDAKEQLAEANIAASNPSMMGKLFSGGSVEAQALQVTAAKHRIAQLEKELREFLIYTGQSEFYNDMLIERRTIRQQRERAAREKAAKRALTIDVIAISVGVAITTIVIVGMIRLITG